MATQPVRTTWLFPTWHAQLSAGPAGMAGVPGPYAHKAPVPPLAHQAKPCWATATATDCGPEGWQVCHAQSQGHAHRAPHAQPARRIRPVLHEHTANCGGARHAAPKTQGVHQCGCLSK
eukprot:519424-Pelagomonas_calceolata.AAC.4